MVDQVRSTAGIMDKAAQRLPPALKLWLSLHKCMMTQAPEVSECGASQAQSRFSVAKEASGSICHPLSDQNRHPPDESITVARK